MTKQEEILQTTVNTLIVEMETLRPTHAKEWATNIAKEILFTLNSQGVVIKMNKPDADFYYEPLIIEEKE